MIPPSKVMSGAGEGLRDSPADSPDDDNSHVQELRKVFEACAASGSGGSGGSDGAGAAASSAVLDREGLARLCGQLRLQPHAAYITAALLPKPHSTIRFPAFKRRFIALLPDVVQLEAAEPLVKDDPGLSPVDAGLGLGSAEEADTSNDVLSEELSDAQAAKLRRSPTSSSAKTLVGLGSPDPPSGELTLGELEAALRELNLWSEGGRVGRFELELLCRQCPRLRSALWPSGTAEGPSLGALFAELDSEGEGAVSLVQLVTRANAQRPKALQRRSSSGARILSDPIMIASGESESQLSPSLFANSPPKAQADFFHKRWKAELLRARDASRRLHSSLESPSPRPLSLSQGPGLGKTSSGAGMGASPPSSSALAPINFFQLVEGSGSGFLRATSVVGHWAGLGLAEGWAVLEDLGLAGEEGPEAVVSVKALCRALETELVEASLSSARLSAAVLSYRAHVEFLAASLGEQESQTAHFRHELHALTQRQNLLVEEMDASQQNLEAAHQGHIQALERGWREEREAATASLVAERESLSTQVGDLEEAVHSLHRQEASRRSRSQLLEKDNLRLKREVAEQGASLADLEALNGDLRRELEAQADAMAKAARLQPSALPSAALSSDDAAGPAAHSRLSSATWKARVETLTAENKRLRDEVDELLEAQRRAQPAKKTARAWNAANRWGALPARAPKTFSVDPHDSSARFRRELHKLKRKKAAQTQGLDSPEFESEEEPFFYRPRVKRRLQNRHRRPTSERRSQRAAVAQPTLSDSNDEPSTSGVALESSRRLASFAAARGGGRSRAAMAEAEADGDKDVAQLRLDFDKERQAWTEQKNHEIRVILEAKEGEREAKEAELQTKFDAEKRALELDFASQRNAADRAFAEEKMEMMARLQEDFDAELRKARAQTSAAKAAAQSASAQAQPTSAARAKGFLGRLGGSGSTAAVSPAVSLGSVDRTKLEELEREKKILEDSLAGQRNGYEAKAAAAKRSYEEKLQSLQAQLDALLGAASPDQLPDKLRAQWDQWTHQHNLTLAAERAALERQRESQEAEASSARASLVEARAALDATVEQRLSHQRSEDQLRMDELQGRLRDAEEARAKTEEALQDLQRQHERATMEKAIVLEGQKTSDSRSQETAARMEALTKENADLRRHFDDRVRELAAEAEAAEAQLRETFAAQERSLQERVQLLEEQKSALIAENAEDMVELESRFKGRAESEADRAARDARTAKLVEEKDSLLERLEEATKKVRQMDAAREEAEREAKAAQDHLEAALDKERRKAASLEANLEAAQSERAKLEERLADARAEVDRSEAAVKVLETEKLSLVESLDSLSSKSEAEAAAKERLRDTEAALAEAKANAENLQPYKNLFEEEQKRRLGLEGQLAELTSRTAELEKSLQEAEETREQQGSSLSSETSTLKHQIAELHNQRLAVDHELAETKEALAAREADVNQLEGELSELDRSRSFEEADAVTKLKADLDTKESELMKLDVAVATLKDRLELETASRNDNETALSKAQAELQKAQADLEKVQTELAASETKCRELEASREEEVQLKTVAVEETQKTASEERVRLVSDLAKAEAALEQTRQTTKAREEEQQLLRREQEELKAKLSEEVLRSENEVAKFQHMAQEAHSQVNLLRSQAEKAEAELASLKAELQEVKEASADSGMEDAGVQTDEDVRAEEDLAALEARLSAELAAQLSALEAQHQAALDQAHSATAAAEHQLRAAQETLERLRGELSTAESSNESQLQRLESEHQAALSQAQSAATSAEQELRSVEASLERLRSELSAAEERARGCERCGELEERVRELEAGVSESGIEDGGGGPPPSTAALEDEILDLRTALAVATSLETRKRAAEGGAEVGPAASLPRLSSGRRQWEGSTEEMSALAGENERLRQERFLLESRLAAKEDVLGETVAAYRAQLRETAGLGRLVQDLWRAHPANGGRDGEDEWRHLEAKVNDAHSTLQKDL